MKKGLIHISLLLTLLSWVTPVLAYSSPGNPSGYVNDFAHVLKIDTVKNLNTKLSEFEASTSNEIVVVTIPSMQGDYIESYAPQLFKEWGIGKKNKDNGVLLLISTQEHKIRIEVGYGLEGSLPDSVAQNIINNDVTPSFKVGDYDSGVRKAVDDIVAATQNEYTVNTNVTKKSSFNIGYIVIVFFLLFIQWIASVFARSKSWWAGGIVGLFFGFGIWTFLGLILWWGLVLSVVFTLFGLLFDFYVSKTYTISKKTNTIFPWWIGGDGSGNGSGGSFGGFGGGSSGGGGASGGW